MGEVSAFALAVFYQAPEIDWFPFEEGQKKGFKKSESGYYKLTTPKSDQPHWTRGVGNPQFRDSPVRGKKEETEIFGGASPYVIGIVGGLILGVFIGMPIVYKTRNLYDG